MPPGIYSSFNPHIENACYIAIESILFSSNALSTVAQHSL